MSSEVSWVFEAAVKPGAADDYAALAREITADNQAAEPGQLNFEWFFDGQDVHICERYTDSPAALLHVQRFVTNFAPRFLSMCTPTRMSVYGEPSEELRTALTDFQPPLPGSRGRLHPPLAPRLARPGEYRGYQFAAAPDAELVERPGQVLLHGVGRDVQFPDDLPGRVPSDDQGHDPRLRVGQAVSAQQY
jgi:quinol monooxygenase YgiN